MGVIETAWKRTHDLDRSLNFVLKSLRKANNKKLKLAKIFWLDQFSWERNVESLVLSGTFSKHLNTSWKFVFCLFLLFVCIRVSFIFAFTQNLSSFDNDLRFKLWWFLDDASKVEEGHSASARDISQWIWTQNEYEFEWDEWGRVANTSTEKKNAQHEI